MDNQQEMTSWLCGFIDGEGSFSNTRRGGCKVNISNTELDAIELCCDILTQLGIFYTVHNQKRSNRKRIYTIAIQGWENCFHLYNAIKDFGLCRIDELKAIVSSSEITRETTANLHWMIGVFEADGTFHISCSKRRGDEILYRPKIGFDNTRPRIIDQVVKTLWAKELSWHIYHHVPTVEKYKEHDAIDICGYKRVKRALDVIVPLIKTSKYKQRTALLQEFVTTRLAQETKEPYTQRQHEIYHILRLMI